MKCQALRSFTTACGALLITLAAISAAESGTIRIEPVLISVVAPGAAAAMKLRNDDQAPANVQIRVFHWLEVGGVEQLVPTDEVVASPPAVTLAPGTDYTVRIVRVGKTSVVGEETYRILVDQVPAANSGAGGSVKLLIRQSIPAFFVAAQSPPPDVKWSISVRGGDLLVEARNDGGTHLRISALKLVAANGKIVSFGDGLVGYVLAHSTVQWKAAGKAAGFTPGGSVALTAVGNLGPISASVPVAK